MASSSAWEEPKVSSDRSAKAPGTTTGAFAFPNHSGAVCPGIQPARLLKLMQFPKRPGASAAAMWVTTLSR